MQVINNSIGQKLVTAVVAFAFFMAMVPGASAKHRASNAAQQPTTIIAHLPLTGASVSELVLQQRGSKQYLYLQQASKPKRQTARARRPFLVQRLLRCST
jgi:hypothetical protein